MGASTANIRCAYEFKNFPKISIGSKIVILLTLVPFAISNLKKSRQYAQWIVILFCCATQCDSMRLNADTDHIEKIRKLFLYNKSIQYDFFHNSSKSSRGVGILISRSLNYSVTRCLKDDNDNKIGLTLKIDDFLGRVFSVYGPNDNNRVFFDNLKNLLETDSAVPIIIGGDWNATYSCHEIGTNIDTYWMVSPPSLSRSLWLNQLCRDLHMCDPFRAMHLWEESHHDSKYLYSHSCSWRTIPLKI